MATFSAHAVQQIKLSLTSDVRNVMITGGGSYHQYFIKELRKSIPLIDVLVPSDVIIQYKEALIFAFLGLLRFKGEVNCLASVTGAGSDSISGAVYL